MAAVMVLVAVFFFIATVVRVPAEATAGQAAAPWPDGAEYLDAAVSLVREGTPSIHVAGETHPSRYPIGYSLLSAAALVLGAPPELAPHRINQLAGAVLLLLVAAFGWRRRPFVGGLAALLLVTLPAFVVLCRSPLSEVSGAVPFLAGVLLLHSYARGGTRARGMAGAVLSGLAVCFRTSGVLLLVFLPAAVAARHGRAWKAALRDLVLFGAAAGLGLLPLFLYNTWTFGSPAANGYGYWTPYWSASRAFQAKFVLPNLAYLLSELLQDESLPTTASLYGQGSYFGPAFVVLALWAPLGLHRGRLFWCFAGAAGFYFAAMTFYFYSDARLLFPLLLLAVPTAAAGVAGLVRRGRAWTAGPAVALVVTALVGWPSPDAPAALALLRPDAKASPAYRLSHQLLRLRGRSPRLVLTDLPPPYVHALSPPGTVVAPLRGDHLFRFNPEVFRFGRTERRRLVVRHLAAGGSVWVLSHASDVHETELLCPPPRGHAWEVVTRDERGGGIARLVAD